MGLLGEAFVADIELLFAPIEVGGEYAEALLVGLELALGGGFFLLGFSLLKKVQPLLFGGKPVGGEPLVSAVFRPLLDGLGFGYPLAGSGGLLLIFQNARHLLYDLLGFGDLLL